MSRQRQGNEDLSISYRQDSTPTLFQSHDRKQHVIAFRILTANGRSAAGRLYLGYEVVGMCRASSGATLARLSKSRS